MIKLPALALFLAVAACDTPPSNSTGGDASTSIAETDSASEGGQLTSSTNDDESSGGYTSEDGSATDAVTTSGGDGGMDGTATSDAEVPPEVCSGAPCGVDADCVDDEGTNTVPRCVDGVCRLQCVPPFFAGICGEDSECMIDENGTGQALCSC